MNAVGSPSVRDRQFQQGTALDGHPLDRRDEPEGSRKTRVRCKSISASAHNFAMTFLVQIAYIRPH